MLKAVDSVNNISYATAATYAPDGQMAGFVSGNGAGFAGITNSFSYNKRLQPINMSASAPGQTVFSIGYDFHLGNGNNGNVYNIYNYRDRNRDQSFTYDALNRLTSAQNAGTNCASTVLNGKTEYWGNSYAYDAWGNLTTKSITKCSAENMSLAVAANNRISTAGYGYDSAGNMTADPTDGGITLTYDPENRITGAAGYTYTYDADGNRVKKSNGSTTTLYWYMTPGIVGESDLSGTMKSEYVFFNGERVARRDLVAPTGVFYYFSDHLKTASVITDSAGVIKADSDYYPWGGELQFVNADSNHYKFTGKERDSESGLDYFGARYYSNGLGRWISADKPFLDQYIEDPQSWNIYSYGRNNPTTLLDSDGKKVKYADSASRDFLEHNVDYLRKNSSTFDDALRAYDGGRDLIFRYEPTEDRDASGTTGIDAAIVNDGIPSPAPSDLGNGSQKPADGLNEQVIVTPTQVTITINDRHPLNQTESGRQETIKHEVGHANDARENPNRYAQQAKQDKHDKDKGKDTRNSPKERRAEHFRHKVDKELKKKKK